MMAPAPEPVVDPAPLPPWSWTVAELGQHLTATQRATVLARLRTIGYAVTTWPSA